MSALAVEEPGTVGPDHHVPDVALLERLGRLLCERYSIDREDERDQLLERVSWRRVASGHVASTPAAAAPRVWMVVLGGLRVRDATAGGAADLDVVPGDVIRLDGPPGQGLVAVRDSVLAGLPPEPLGRLVSAAPQLLLGGSWPVVGRSASRAARADVVAVVAGEGLDRRYVTSWLVDGLSTVGDVEALWPARVDALLSSAGVAECEPGEEGDGEVARLFDDVEARAEAVVLEVGAEPDAWSRRALGAADRVAVVARADVAGQAGPELLRLLDHAPPGVPRELVLLAVGAGPPAGTGRVLDRTGCQRVHHVVGGFKASGERDRVARLLRGRGRVLVLSGGGARGFAHLGVHRALHELGIEIDGFVGSSIGSPLAAGMADDIPPDALVPLVEELFSRVLDYTLPVVALAAGRRIATATERVFSDREIEDLRRRFACVSTDLTTARAHVHRRGSLVHAVRASCAIPGVLPPVPANGHLLVDGGVTDNLPVGLARELAPAGEVIAADVIPPVGPRARTDYGMWIGGVRAARQRDRLPRLASTIMRSLTVASEQRRRRGAGRGADCHLRLDLGGVSLLDFGTVRTVAQRGYDQAMPVLEQWLEDRAAGTSTERSTT